MYYQVIMRKKVAGKVQEEVVIPEMLSNANTVLSLVQTVVRRLGKVEVAVFRKKRLSEEYKFFQSMSKIF